MPNTRQILHWQKRRFALLKESGYSPVLVHTVLQITGLTDQIKMITIDILCHTEFTLYQLELSQSRVYSCPQQQVSPFSSEKKRENSPDWRGGIASYRRDASQYWCFKICSVIREKIPRNIPWLAHHNNSKMENESMIKKSIKIISESIQSGQGWLSRLVREKCSTKYGREVKWLGCELNSMLIMTASMLKKTAMEARLY